ncbi:hypothetical protein PYK22_01602 [Pyrinomonas methylaliphatogenes]|jgi:hypothetical protein|uniref:Uncharacterized protein n=1 Tax=Pyrinomonas methylaliphatogenes TaxID=454194 RepID=A0A0B6WY15_9BACT|nr:hypothetical protein PYK22_01602 [Pyrinomonas methylaliphatogenes]
MRRNASSWAEDKAGKVSGKRPIMLGKSRLLAQIIVVSGEGKLKGADNVRSHQGEPIGLSDARALRIPIGAATAAPFNPYVQMIEALRRFSRHGRAREHRAFLARDRRLAATSTRHHLSFDALESRLSPNRDPGGGPRIALSARLHQIGCFRRLSACVTLRPRGVWETRATIRPTPR